MDDNARPHQTLAIEELLESEDITRMDWPAYSPNLNLIEHVWDALGRRIAARLHHPENNQQLKQMLIEEWVLLPQEMLHQLVLSMRRRPLTSRNPSQLKSELALRMIDLAGFTIRALICPQNFLRYLDWYSETNSSVFKYLFHQTMTVQVSIHATRGEMGLNQNIAIGLGDQRYPECLNIHLLFHYSNHRSYGTKSKP
ncbi:transposable element Tcb2 transposase [Trichonephila clavipes]|nr:transposable element Tcb2 transposase [Trichonephila clavipes]